VKLRDTRSPALLQNIEIDVPMEKRKKEDKWGKGGIGDKVPGVSISSKFFGDVIKGLPGSLLPFQAVFLRLWEVEALLDATAYRTTRRRVRYFHGERLFLDRCSDIGEFSFSFSPGSCRRFAGSSRRRFAFVLSK